MSSFYFCVDLYVILLYNMYCNSKQLKKLYLGGTYYDKRTESY